MAFVVSAAVSFIILITDKGTINTKSTTQSTIIKKIHPIFVINLHIPNVRIPNIAPPPFAAL